MIVKGIIKTINFSENSCTVRLPLFETAAADGEVILDAIISIQPGLYNGYTEGDVVFVDFENNKLSQPIVVGKLYLGAEKEAANGAPSAMTVSNLKVTTQATLPVDTRLSLEGLGNIVPVEKGISSYHSLVDIIKALHQTETSVQQTIKDQSGTVSNIIVEYLSQPVDQEAPTAENTGWNITSPDYKDGFEIWQKTTCYNHRGQALSTEIICLSSIASAVIYKVRCSTRVHAGTNQTEAVKISAWVKLGTELETSDTSANICYCWSDGKGSALTDWIESGTYEVTLEPAQLRAQNLVIQVKHGSEVYEEETIMYAPLNTPVLHLSNEADVLLYAANGTDCLATAGVSSTATLYVNGDPLEATYVWEWNPKLCTCEHAVDEGGQQLQNTIIVTAVNSTSAPGVVTCKATVTLDGPFKGKVYSKDFTVTQTKIGTSIISQETYYALIHSRHSAGAIKTPPKTGDLIVRDKDGNQLNTINESQLEEWSLTPPEHTPDTNGWKYWTTVKTTYSTSLDDFEFSTPIINEDLSGVYSLAQGKTTNYYGNFEPTRNPEPSATQVYKPNLRVDDCWFDTNYKEISTTELATLDFASKYINYYVGEGDTKTLVTGSNYTTLSIQPKTTKAYIKGALKQCTAIAANGNATWEDIGDEIVTNKLTATYINALDITAKKIKILNDAGNTTLFEADGLSNTRTVKIAGFKVNANGLFTYKDETPFVTAFSPAGTAGATAEGVYVGKDGIKLGQNFSVDQSGNVIASSLKISSSQTIGEALEEVANNAQTNLENAFPTPATSTYTTLGDKWLSTTDVYAQNLHVANADITNQILVGTAEKPILYANVTDSENVKIGGFKVSSTQIRNENDLILSTTDLSSNLSIAGHSSKDWRLTIGTKFGVKDDGVLYAQGAKFKDGIVPTASGDGSVGTSTLRWGNIYGANIDAKGTLVARDSSGTEKFKVDQNGKITTKGALEATGKIVTKDTLTCKGGFEVRNAADTGNLFQVGIDDSGTPFAGTAAMHANLFVGDKVQGTVVQLAALRTYYQSGSNFWPGTGGILYLRPSLSINQSSPNCFWSTTVSVSPGWSTIYPPTEFKCTTIGGVGYGIKSVLVTAKSTNGTTPGSDDKNSSNPINETNFDNKWFVDWNPNGREVYIYNGLSQTGSACVVVAALI